MGNAIIALIIVLSMNAFMMMAQSAVEGVNPETTFYEGDGGIIEQHNIDTANPYADLPGGGASIETESGNVFTDIFGSIKKWLSTSIGENTFMKSLKAPYTYLKAAGLPSDFVNIIGTMWYVITIGIIVLVLWGRQS